MSTVGRIGAPMKAPKSSGTDREKNPNLELIDEGIQDAYLVGIIGLGTHSEKKFQSEEKVDKNKILLIWEFPQLKQRIYLDDDELYPFQIYDEKVFSFHEKASLRKVMKALDNNQTPDDQFDDVDLFSLLHKPIKLGIEHNVGKDGTTRAKIVSYTKMGKQTPAVKCGDTAYLFYIDEQRLHFMTENFAELPNWIKEKIKKSNEAVEYAAQGGVFAERERSDEDNKQSSAPEPPSSNKQKPQVKEGFEFIGTDATYESYIEQGWTDRQLYDAGLLVKKKVTPPPAQEEKKPTPPPPPSQSKEAPATNVNPFEDDDDDDLPF